MKAKPGDLAVSIADIRERIALGVGRRQLSSLLSSMSGVSGSLLCASKPSIIPGPHGTGSETPTPRGERVLQIVLGESAHMQVRLWQRKPARNEVARHLLPSQGWQWKHPTLAWHSLRRFLTIKRFADATFHGCRRLVSVEMNATPGLITPMTLSTLCNNRCSPQMQATRSACVASVSSSKSSCGNNRKGSQVFRILHHPVGHWPLLCSAHKCFNSLPSQPASTFTSVEEWRSLLSFDQRDSLERSLTYKGRVILEALNYWRKSFRAFWRKGITPHLI